MFYNFCEKFENSKWLPFLAREFFLKIGMDNLQRYPVGKKFHRNCSIVHGFRDISIFVFCNFCQKFKMAAIFGKIKIFGKKCSLICGDTLWVKNFVEIALFHMVFEI